MSKNNWIFKRVSSSRQHAEYRVYWFSIAEDQITTNLAALKNTILLPFSFCRSDIWTQISWIFHSGSHKADINVSAFSHKGWLRTNLFINGFKLLAEFSSWQLKIWSQHFFFFFFRLLARAHAQLLETFLRF